FYACALALSWLSFSSHASATLELYTLSLHDALPISGPRALVCRWTCGSCSPRRPWAGEMAESPPLQERPGSLPLEEEPERPPLGEEPESPPLRENPESLPLKEMLASWTGRCGCSGTSTCCASVPIRARGRPSTRAMRPPARHRTRPWSPPASKRPSPARPA